MKKHVVIGPIMRSVAELADTYRELNINWSWFTDTLWNCN